jgi:copper chaperone CopZ
VKKVEIDLASGKVEIDTETEIGKSDLENAIKEAGYELK